MQGKLLLKMLNLIVEYKNLVMGCGCCVEAQHLKILVLTL